MIVRIARVKVGNRQAPLAENPNPALKSGVWAFTALKNCLAFREPGLTELVLLSERPSSSSQTHTNSSINRSR